MKQNLAFVFPGQGSQAIGMLSEFSDNTTSVRSTFDGASEVLGYDLWRLTQDGPEADLNRTDKTQPALLTAGVALWRLWLEKGGAKPSVMAGHSLGEYTALVCSGALNFEDGVALVRARGEYMQEAVPPGQGAMAAILGLADELIEKACSDAAQGGVVAPVNYNSPGQVVIAGEKAAVERAIEACKAAGAKKAIPLPVSVPSHCALMQPAADKLAVDLEKVAFNVPEIPVIQNVDAQPSDTAEVIRKKLVAQLYSPVLWTRTVQSMIESGIGETIECGPGKVLAGLNKRIDRSLTAGSLCDAASLAKMLEG